MATCKLESLVLRGVAVLRDGRAVNTRRGTGYVAGTPTPEIAFSMRHPSPGCVPCFAQPAMRLDQAEYLRVDAQAAFGAGRSHSRARAGVLSRSNGGTQSTTATNLRLMSMSGRVAAFVSEGVLPLAGKADLRRHPLVWCKPAQRTPPASTRGKGAW
jgi:hypothetical protein